MNIDKDKASYRLALKSILRWDFTTDGRKFNGNHKQVVKQIMELARMGLGLKDLNKSLKSNKKP